MRGQIRGVGNPREYIASLEEPRRSEVAALDRLVRKAAPGLKPVIQGGMLGYGPLRYRYASGREGEAARIGIASNASYISLYVLSADSRGYLAERYRHQLPGAKVGKSCVRFRRLGDLDLEALRQMIAEAARTPYGDAEQVPAPAPSRRDRLLRRPAKARLTSGHSARRKC